jgi:hypothetical protein
MMTLTTMELALMTLITTNTDTKCKDPNQQYITQHNNTRPNGNQHKKTLILGMMTLTITTLTLMTLIITKTDTKNDDTNQQYNIQHIDTHHNKHWHSV